MLTLYLQLTNQEICFLKKIFLLLNWFQELLWQIVSWPNYHIPILRLHLLDNDCDNDRWSIKLWWHLTWDDTRMMNDLMLVTTTISWGCISYCQQQTVVSLRPSSQDLVSYLPDVVCAEIMLYWYCLVIC